MTVRYSTEFAKTAGAWDTFKSVATSPGVVIPTAATAAGFGLNAVRDVLSDAMEARRKAQAFKGMIASHPVLKNKDQKDVRNIYNSLYNINPHMAKDPLVAGALVDRIYQRQESFGGRDATSNQGLLETAQELAGIRSQLSSAHANEGKGRRDMSQLTERFGDRFMAQMGALEQQHGAVAAARRELEAYKQQVQDKRRDDVLKAFSKATGGKSPTKETLDSIAAHAQLAQYASRPDIQAQVAALNAAKNRSSAFARALRNQAPPRADSRPSRYGDLGRAVESAFNELRNKKR